MNKSHLINRLTRVVPKKLGDDKYATLWCNQYTYENFISHICTNDIDPKLILDTVVLYIFVEPNTNLHFKNGEVMIKNDIGINQHNIKLENYTNTRGDVIVDDIDIGDILYEYDYGVCVRSKVITKPIRDGIFPDLWTWTNVRLTDTDLELEEINYSVNSRYQHYAPKLYTYRAYPGIKIL